MFAVLFEVCPAPSKRDGYLALAAHLKPLLESTDGFLSNERFASLNREGWLLSLSLWRDEKSVVRWRSQGDHHAIQLQGRAGIFADYHLRVGEVTADNVGQEPKQQRFDETEVGAAKAVGVTQWHGATDPDWGFDGPGEALVAQDTFESITNPGKRLLLTSWRTATDAARWSPPQALAAHHQRVRNIRDYGLFDRREAPQFCPVVTR